MDTEPWPSGWLSWLDSTCFSTRNLMATRFHILIGNATSCYSGFSEPLEYGGRIPGQSPTGFESTSTWQDWQDAAETLQNLHRWALKPRQRWWNTCPIGRQSWLRGWNKWRQFSEGRLIFRNDLYNNVFLYVHICIYIYIQCKCMYTQKYTVAVACTCPLADISYFISSNRARAFASDFNSAKSRRQLCQI